MIEFNNYRITLLSPGVVKSIRVDVYQLDVQLDTQGGGAEGNCQRRAVKLDEHLRATSCNQWQWSTAVNEQHRVAGIWSVAKDQAIFRGWTVLPYAESGVQCC